MGKGTNVVLIVVGLAILILGGILGTVSIGSLKLGDSAALIIGLVGSMFFLFGIFNFFSWRTWIKIALSIVVPLILLLLFWLIVGSAISSI